MSENKKIENWLRGKVDGISDLLQPAAHAFLQSKEEVSEYLHDFPESELWVKPFGRASVAFHLQHIAGVTDRLLTYAKGEQLSEEQLNYLKSEGIPDEKLKLKDLIEKVEKVLDEAVDYLRDIEETELTQKVEIGRKQIPSTLMGVLFHAAEHSQRHIGQMLVTASVVKGENH